MLEILSPQNAKYDFEEKKEVYERYGVEEYFIIEPETKQVYRFKLTNGEFVESETQKGIITSVILNTTIQF